MWKSTGAALLVLATAGATTLATATPASAEAAHAPAEALESSGEVVVRDTTGGGDDEPAGSIICRFDTRGDRVHISSTANEASGHGWWVNGDCDTTQAVVMVQLQQYTGGSWNDVGRVGQETVRSGGGSANRATGRAACNSSATTTWRSVVDADLVGIVDDPFTRTTEPRQIPCRN
ncbi:hypothetical protein CDO52_07025 [Nocardiopsis gilva YIM 90087]|uniref:Secreted protein n=1 Tax=Nocardiopsis gilva YIM 90087 TaxID=1235441 RepID=A0A223S378_9ACTN|nr:hypothetical protein [Nocardiopsis gilva]ASU82568.1 hypothetical protein CDO52_07025 [Nocardiopsis gilva YIM 90087]